MPDREKVINGLTTIQDQAYDRWVHQQYMEDPLITLIRDNISDALTLLREQEPVEPKWIDFEDSFTGDKFKVPLCGNCESLLGDALYCPRCGRAVKWDDR